MTGVLAGKRVLVIGASAGIGQAFAERAVREDAQVVLVARRADKLAETVSRAGGGTAIVGDVCAEGDPAKVVAQASEELGSLDLVYFAVGYATLGSLLDTTAKQWREVFETNVLGLHETLRAAVPVMAPNAIAAVISSEIVSHPRPGLATYSSSKAAVEDALRLWQIEHPEVRFSCLSVGATQPTEFGSNFDPEVLGEMMGKWTHRGLSQERFMDTQEVAHFCAVVYGAALSLPSLNIEYISLRSPSPVVGTTA